LSYTLTTDRREGDSYPHFTHTRNTVDLARQYPEWMFNHRSVILTQNIAKQYS